MNADIYVRQRKTLADRDALLAEMRKRAVVPPPTPLQACSGDEAKLKPSRTSMMSAGRMSPSRNWSGSALLLRPGMGMRAPSCAASSSRRRSMSSRRRATETGAYALALAGRYPGTGLAERTSDLAIDQRT
jgi:hypothetical protein